MGDDELENNCFICGIGKDYLDSVPHGFDIHVQKEHNLANYLFFLMYLIGKDPTEYTGQETYCGTCINNGAGTFSLLETASENNTSPSSRVVAVVNESQKKSLNIFPSQNFTAYPCYA